MTATHSTATQSTNLAEGDRLPSAAIAIAQPMIDTYAEISGDFNPLHVDPVAAAATPFGTTIAHGCIPMEPLFQSLLRWLDAPVFPPDTAMTLRLLRPSRPGDTIDVEARLVPGDGGDKVAFTCRNQNGEPVIEGQCTIPATRSK